MKQMNQHEMKDCPYCAEPIQADAVKCRYCGSDLDKTPPDERVPAQGNYWRRVSEGKRIAGVCTGIAREFNAPRLILPLRIFFILTTVFYGFGFITYIVLWLLMPSPADTADVRDSDAAGRRENGASPEPTIHYTKKTHVGNILFGMALLITGLFILATPILHGGYRFLPIGVRVEAPLFMQVTRHFFDIGWITGIFPLMIVLGFLLLFFGMIKALRVSIGCGMIAMGSLLMLSFPALLPRALFMPGLPIMGILFIGIGFAKLLFGSTKNIEEPGPEKGTVESGDRGWGLYDETGRSSDSGI